VPRGLLTTLAAGLGVLAGLALPAAGQATALEWSVTQTIPIADALYPSLSPDETTVYVGEATSASPNGRLWIVDVATGTATAVTDGLLSRPYGCAVSADGSTLLVASRVNPGWVARMDTSTRAFAGTGISSANWPVTISITPDGAVALIAIQNGDAVGFLRMSDLTEIRSPVTLGGSESPRQIAISSDSTTAYITTADTNDVVVMTIATGALGVSIPVGALPTGIAITPDGAQAWVANTNGDSISVIDLRTESVIHTITMQSNDAPFGIAFTPDGRSALVANRDSGTGAVIDRSTRLETQRLSVGGSPRAVVITRDGLRAFVGADEGGLVELEFPPTPASGPNVPTAPMQQFGRLEGETCAGRAPEYVNWPGLGPRLQQENWGESWAQWPNAGTGGFVCTRQPFFTTNGSWALS